ncbi:MAG: outer membrane beta-barrel protein [Bacteroidales bacterium]|nr:outer membrane beta-barrel protein [Bacteroidales bacterium]
MDNRWSNIDLVFRNGLKNYEVLPPPEVWNNLRPVIRKKQKPYMVLRAAAFATVVLSLSFLAYRWSKEISARLENPVISVNEESVAPVTSPIIASLLPEGRINNDNSFRYEGTREEVQPENILIPGNNTSTSRAIIYPSVSGGFSLNEISRNNSDLMAINYPRTSSVNTYDFNTQILPATSAGNEIDRWTIAALIAPTYYTSFRSGNDEFSREIMKSEQPLFSYSGGVALAYKINKRFSIQSGLYFSSVGQMVEGITSFSGFRNYDNTKGDHNFEVLTANGTVYTNNADVFLLNTGMDSRIQAKFTNEAFDPVKANLEYLDNSLRQNFSYLEVPFVVKYKVIDKTFDFNLIGGLSSNLLVNNSVYASVDGGKYQVGKTQGMNAITFSSSFGMGMEYNVNRNLSLNLEPTFRYYLNPFNELSGLKFHPYSFGIFSGLSFKF